MSTDDLVHDTPDDLGRALDLLARRADRQAPSDRLPAVHRRARRRARQRTAALAAAVVLAVAGGGALVDGVARSDRGSGPAVTPTQAPNGLFDVVQVTDPVVVGAAAGPYAGTGARVVVVDIVVDGAVPGTAPAGAAEGSGSSEDPTPFAVRVEQPGLGFQGSGDAPRCPPGAPLVDVTARESVTLVYGPDFPDATADVIVTLTACAPVGAVTRGITVRVPPPTTAPPTG